MSTDNAAPVEEQEDIDVEVQAAKKRDTRPRHPEALALQRILWELDELSQDEAERVVQFVYSRHCHMRDDPKRFIDDDRR